MAPLVNRRACRSGYRVVKIVSIGAADDMCPGVVDNTYLGVADGIYPGVDIHKSRNRRQLEQVLLTECKVSLILAGRRVLVEQMAQRW